jgi:hypothetical protein
MVFFIIDESVTSFVPLFVERIGPVHLTRVNAGDVFLFIDLAAPQHQEKQQYGSRV